MAPLTDRLASTRGFIREHLVPFNTLLLLSASTMAALDFLAPRFSLLPLIVYCITAALCAALLLAAYAPGPLNRLVAALLQAVDATCLRSNPSWQISVAILGLTTMLGAVSVAKAGSGGILASSSKAVSTWQADFLGLQKAASQIKAGTGEANAKLDAITVKLNAATFAGDNCPTLDCAVGMGTSEATLKSFIAQGARLPTEPVALGAAINRLSKSRNPARVGTVGVYLDAGALTDINARAAIVANPRAARA